MSGQCLRCHGPEQKKGGLDLSRRAGLLKGGKSGVVVVPGSPEESTLVDKITDGEMPPKAALPREQVETIRAWVKSGAHYGSEPLEPPRAGRLVVATTDPSGGRAASSAGQLGLDQKSDRCLHSCTRARQRPRSAPEADRRSLFRRVSFDLTGLPPAPDAVEQFVADPDPRAYEALVDRLLASPHYGERWGRHWLDVVRFGESEGYETNLPRGAAWPFREYVIRAFNRDTPFPRFVFEQLAGDTLGRSGADPEGGSSGAIVQASDRPDWLTEAATGFLVGGAHDVVGNQTLEGMLQQRADDLDDMITATGTTFLGLTIQCARCHDHKFDPITQNDYYGLQAILAGVNHGEREVRAPDSEARTYQAGAVAAELCEIQAQLDSREPIAAPGRDQSVRPMVNPMRNVERFAPVPARMVRMTILATNNQTEPCLDEVEVYSAAVPGGAARANVALAAAGGRAIASSEYPGAAIHKIAHLNDGLTGNSHSWISKVPGKGSITLSWPETVMIDRVVWGRDREGAFRDRLATEYYVEAAVEPSRWQVVASSLDRGQYNSQGNQASTAALSPSNAAASQEQASLAKRASDLRRRLAELSSTMKVYAGTFSQPGRSYLLLRGDPTRKGPGVSPAGIAALESSAITRPAIA